MVSVIEDFQKFILKRKQELVSIKSLESCCYYYLVNSFNSSCEKPNCLVQSNLQSLNEEILAKIGYVSNFEKEFPLNENIRKELDRILKTRPLSGVHYSLDTFTLLGIYLLADRIAFKNSELQSHVENVLKEGSLKDKFLMSVHKKQFNKIFNIDFCQTLSDWLIHYLIGTARSDLLENKDRRNMSENIVKCWNASFSSSLDLIDIFLVEYWLTNELKGSLLYKEHTSLSLIKEILANFSNSILKVTKNRRKDHSPFEVNDEYDVQDLIYLMLKPIFKDLKEEEYAPKTGGKSTRIDLVIPSEDIVIETKMIKVCDTNEDKFIKEIKEDIQSYYKYPNLKWLIVFVYDPLRKTKDDNNFYDLNKTMKINEKEFEVLSIIAH